MQDLLLVFVGAAIVNNFLLTRFLGVCPFLGVTRELKASVAMGGAVTFVMLTSVAILWPIVHFVLLPLNLVFLQYVVFILVIAVLVQTLEMVIKQLSPAVYDSFGIYLALITTNCAILGLVLLVFAGNYGFVKAMVFGLGAGAGYTLAMAMMAAIREELDLVDVPQSLRGPAIALITGGLMALSFMGFAGLGA